MIINENINLGYSATFRAMVHIILMPFIVFSVIYFIDKQWSLLGSVLYILTISFLQWYRARLYPTVENIFRKDTFFNLLTILVGVVFGLILFILVLVIA